MQSKITPNLWFDTQAEEAAYAAPLIPSKYS
jgi:predicted 3-demethylubiquinone-9 3-methyltransferase (glyoxalase superfamily)